MIVIPLYNIVFVELGDKLRICQWADFLPPCSIETFRLMDMFAEETESWFELLRWILIFGNVWFLDSILDRLPYCFFCQNLRAFKGSSGLMLMAFSSGIFGVELRNDYDDGFWPWHVWLWYGWVLPLTCRALWPCSTTEVKKTLFCLC